MVRWPAGGTRDSTRVFKTAPSDGFPCDFNVVCRLGPFHEAGQAVGLHGCRGY